MRCFVLFLIFLFLTGCHVNTRLPSQLYSEPDAESVTASLRVITNGEVLGAEYEGGCVDGAVGQLASKGRYKDGEVNVVSPPFPWPPKTIGMLDRLAPEMPRYGAVRRVAAGTYGESVAEYRVPAETPFILIGDGVYAPYTGGLAYTCPRVVSVFEFERGKQYEAFVGISKAAGDSLYCVFSVYELKSKIEYIQSGFKRVPAKEIPEVKICEQ